MWESVNGREGKVLSGESILFGVQCAAIKNIAPRVAAYVVIECLEKR